MAVSDKDKPYYTQAEQMKLARHARVLYINAVISKKRYDAICKKLTTRKLG